MTNFRAIWAILTATILTVTALAQVENNRGTASISVQPKLSVVKIADADWGKVVPPTSGRATYLLDYRTGNVTCSSGSGFAFGDGRRGEFLVSGAAGAPIAYSVEIATFGGSGVSIVSAIANGNVGHGTDMMGPDGTYSVKIGGTLELTSEASLESHSVVVTLTVNYN